VPTRIAKSFDFDAAHSLPLLPEGHKCKRLHGHTYRVEFVLCGEPAESGMVADYAEIEAAWLPVHQRLDHQHLNSIPELGPISTTERLAWFIMKEFRHAAPDLPLVLVRVYESSSTWAEVWPPPISRAAETPGAERP